VRETHVDLYSRLRRPESPWTVPGSLPVLFFGDLLGAEVATVGLNPSDKEYLAADGSMLAGQAQRFATLDSLGASERAGLSDAQCAEAVEWMRDYYEPSKPVYSAWFNGLTRVVEGFGASFRGAVQHISISSRRRRDPSGRACRQTIGLSCSEPTCPSSSGRSVRSRCARSSAAARR